jgi:hypothetical protein
MESFEFCGRNKKKLMQGHQLPQQRQGLGVDNSQQDEELQ